MRKRLILLSLTIIACFVFASCGLFERCGDDDGPDSDSPPSDSVTYKVSFDKQGGEGAAEEITVTKGFAYGALPGGVTRDGITFAGWWTKSIGQGAQVTAATIAEQTAGHTLYAKWECIITTPQEFRDFAQRVNSGQKFTGVFVEIRGNIDLGNDEWTPIGNGSENYFNGYFDGKDFTVSNFKITAPLSYMGLFGYNNGEIKNLTVSGVNINSESFSNLPVYAGGLIGYNNEGSAVNCLTFGSVAVNGSKEVYAGGVIGNNFGGDIKDCFAAAVVAANGNSVFAGGVIGANRGTVTGSCATGNVTAVSALLSAYAGGFAGYNTYGEITDCFSTGDVNSSGSLAFAGGFIGINGAGIITFCYSVGNVKANSAGYVTAGGFAGENGGSLIKCFASGTADAVSTAAYARAGGLAGHSEAHGLIMDCRAIGNVVAGGKTVSYGGGLVGQTTQEGAIKNSNAYGNVSTVQGNSSVYILGGLVGNNEHDIEKSCAYGNITADCSDVVFAGGLIGYHGQSSVKICYAEGRVDVDTTLRVYAGGLVGQNNSVIENSYAKGTVTAKSTEKPDVFAGGVSGYNDGLGTIISCYAAGDVIAAALSSLSFNCYAFAGGISGYNHQGGVIKNCLATGNISAEAEAVHGYVNSASAGGIAGQNNGTAANCFRFSGQIFSRNEGPETYDDFSSSEGEECEIADLNSAEFFTKTLKWDANIWDFLILNFEQGELPRLVGV